MIKYRNMVDVFRSDFKLPPIEMDIPRSRKVEIPTAQIDDEEFSEFGQLSEILICPGSNIIAELAYNGKIQCRNDESEASKMALEPQDFPVINPLFHSENLVSSAKGVYTFKTKLAVCRKVSLPSVEDIKKSLPSKIRSKYVSSITLPEKLRRIIPDSGNLEEILGEVAIYLPLIFNDNPRKSGYFSFKALMEEFLSIGKISGDCKAVSTVTAAILNSLGLPARTISGSITALKEGAPATGHAWTETYIPGNVFGGYWIPVDMAMGTIKDYPFHGRRYTLNGAHLPKFLNEGANTASLKLQYTNSLD
ncbi:transglutaminase domain-containing protein [Candidatus Pacearchaeota archaeon]|nr:transglutaminase domain-containing protein [Candidatus Pacearchaeota archaeon]